MRIWDYAVDNRPAIYILILVIVIFGYGSYQRLPRELSPDITIPLVIVATPYVGVSPADMEGLVTQPLERGLKGLRDIKQISSVSKDGLSTIRVEFNTGVDIDDALRRVRDKVNSTRPQLPADGAVHHHPGAGCQRLRRSRFAGELLRQQRIGDPVF